MNFFNAFGISASGLSAQRVRMNVATSNLANINTTRTRHGGPYRRKDVVFSSRPATGSFRNTLRSTMAKRLTGVRVSGIIEDPRPPISKYAPQHPEADKKGYIKVPRINLMEEMVNMMSATRSYEANVTAIKATKDMAKKALEIGR
ncbi:MAG: flagellar basal body rod protein FlgC [Deltaproteobacteria bacterium]|nr:flagellar basal body rod protein FlgC [Deltaproteobacteria bacterium]